MSAPSSRSDKKSIEKMKERELNKLYWARVALAAAAGVVSAMLYVYGMGDIAVFSPVIFYLASFAVYVFKDQIQIIGKKKAGYHGIGSYIITWLVVYMLVLTLILG
ncbi:MAG: hypothetical protein RXR18_03550 [Nitrososphaeria archaeon]